MHVQQSTQTRLIKVSSTLFFFRFFSVSLALKTQRWPREAVVNHVLVLLLYSGSASHECHQWCNIKFHTQIHPNHSAGVIWYNWTHLLNTTVGLKLADSVLCVVLGGFVLQGNLKDKRHSFEDSEVHILDSEDQWFERGVMEAVYLKLQQPSFLTEKVVYNTTS